MQSIKSLQRSIRKKQRKIVVEQRRQEVVIALLQLNHSLAVQLFNLKEQGTPTEIFKRYRETLTERPGPYNP